MDKRRIFVTEIRRGDVIEHPETGRPMTVTHVSSGQTRKGRIDIDGVLTNSQAQTGFSAHPDADVLLVQRQ